MGKAKKKPKKKYTGPKLIDRLPNDRGEWLELCISFTTKRIHNPPYKEDQFLIDQAKRLNAELYIWRERERQDKTPAS